MKTVEILSIGDELLRGIVQDTNAHWVAKRVTARGAELRRVTMLPDEPPVVAQELRAAIGRAPTLIVSHGGLGPTDDDRTREALALALDAPLAPHAEAEAIVQRRYAELHRAGTVGGAELTEDRLRMARLPQGSAALDNQVGAAPGVVARAGETTIVALPGVPSELHWIWENSLARTLDEVLGPGGFDEQTFTIVHRDESAIAWLLRAIQERHPSVYVKSRAAGFGDDDLLRITLAARGGDDAEARALAEAAQGDARAALRAEGIEIRE